MSEEIKEALEDLLEQAHQMQPMFDDEDGAIQKAITKAEDALEFANEL